MEEPHFAIVQLFAVAIGAHLERGELDAADALTTRVTPAAIAEDRTYMPAFLDARGCLRIAQGRCEDGVADLLWAGRLMEGRGACRGQATGGSTPLRRCPHSASATWPTSSHASSSRSPGGWASPAHWACRCAPRPGGGRSRRAGDAPGGGGDAGA